MKNLFVGLLAVVAIASCKKEDPAPPVEYPVSAGKYSIAFDTSIYRIDSMQVIYNDPGGVKTAHVHEGASWESPTIQYRENDSAFAQVTAWGRYKLYTAPFPRMKFSGIRKNGTDFHTDVLEEQTIDGKNAFIVGRHEKY